ncbi:hypothetical protein EYS14_13480 [Alteromonadaceae bacterium M269]|nr:hypothetical protein EYS14_13480 [Alteromonadaceae bacterium M269]
MNAPKPSQDSPVLEAFGKAIGVLAALIMTLPVNKALYPVFEQYALSYVTYEYREAVWLFDLIFLLCVFFFIYACAWFVFVMGFKLLTKGFVNLVRGTALLLALIFSSLFRR